MTFTEAKHEARHQRQLTKVNQCVIHNKEDKNSEYTLISEDQAKEIRLRTNIKIYYKTRSKHERV